MKIKFTKSLVQRQHTRTRNTTLKGLVNAITLTDVEDLITPGSYATETTILYDQSDTIHDHMPRHSTHQKKRLHNNKERFT